jgi:hypothetical protein
MAHLSAMVATIIGWASSDILLAIKVVRKASKALSGSGDSVDAYAEAQAFFESFENIPSRINSFATDHATSVDAGDIGKHLYTILKPWQPFESYLAGFEGSLAHKSSLSLTSSPLQDRVVNSRISKLTRSRAKIRWAFKNLDGEVQELKTAIAQPLSAIQTLLLLHLVFVIFRDYC